VPRFETLEDRTLLSTFHVLNLDDAGDDSLRAAIEAANLTPGADRIVFAPNLTGTITLGSPLSVTDDLKILGPGSDRLTVSGGGTTRVFQISGPEPVVRIDSLTIADGRGATAVGSSGPVTLGGGILNNGADLTISSVVLVHNQATAVAVTSAAGGGIANVFGATLTVRSCTFVDNRSIGPSAGTGDSRGGAIFNDAGSTLIVMDSEFRDNAALGGSTGAQPHQGASLGGAIENAGGSLATVSGSTFEGNLARGADGNPLTLPSFGRGGAIDNWRFSLLGADAASTLTVRDSIFMGNQAVGGDGIAGTPGGQGSGGAIVSGGAGSLSIVIASTFTDNRAVGGAGGAGVTGTGGAGGSAFGGAMNVGSAALTVRDCWLESNQALGGAGGAGASGFAGGGGGYSYGGGIYSGTVTIGPVFTPTLDVRGTIFMDNRAVAGASGNGTAGLIASGGGICAVNNTRMDVRSSSFFGNQAIGGAGGRGANGGNGTGGAIFAGIPPLSGGASGSITNCTLDGNEARGGAGGLGGNGGAGNGGGIFHGSGFLTVSQTIITGNKATGGPAGSGGAVGIGTGGGIFNVFRGGISIDAVDLIFGNEVDLFPDRFNC